MSDEERVWQLDGYVGVRYYNSFYLIHPSYNKAVKDGKVFFKDLSGNSLRIKILSQGTRSQVVDSFRSVKNFDENSLIVLNTSEEDDHDNIIVAHENPTVNSHLKQLMAPLPVRPSSNIIRTADKPTASQSTSMTSGKTKPTASQSKTQSVKPTTSQSSPIVVKPKEISKGSVQKFNTSIKSSSSKVSQSQPILSKNSPSNVSSSSTVKRVQFPLGVNNETTDINNNYSDSDTSALILEDEPKAHSSGSRKRSRLPRSPSSLENFQAISESLNPTKRSALEQKVARLEKVVGVGKALEFNNANLIDDFDAPTYSMYAIRLAKHLWTEDELRNGLIQDRGAPFRPGTIRRPLDSQMDRKKIKLLQDAIRRKFNIKDEKWATTWGECRSSINALNKPSVARKRDANRVNVQREKDNTGKLNEQEGEQEGEKEDEQDEYSDQEEEEWTNQEQDDTNGGEEE